MIQDQTDANQYSEPEVSTQMRRRYLDRSTTERNWAYSAQSNIAVTAEGRECEKEDKGKGKEEISVYSQPIQFRKNLARQRKVRKVGNTTIRG